MKFWDYVEEPGHKSDSKAKTIVEASVAKVHKIFRLQMGAVDQDSVKARVQGVTREMTRYQPQKQLAHIAECAVSAAHCNYNIDDYDAEYFTEQHSNFLDELSASAKTFRKRGSLKMKEDPKPPKKKQRCRTPKNKRSAKNVYGTRTQGGSSCPAIGNLAAALRFSPVEGTGKDARPAMQRRKCAFCGYAKTSFMCSGCGQRYCLRPPTRLENPGTPGKKFRVNGPNCWQLDHGVQLASFRNPE